jgi:hypothetical protein
MGDEPAKGDRMAGRRRRLKKDYKVSKSMTEYHKRRRNAAPRGTISDKGEFGTMNNSFHHSPEERRRLAARIIEEAGGKAPKGVALVDFRDPTPDELASAETLAERARTALKANAKRTAKQPRAAA